MFNIGFIGAGNMGGAIARSAMKTGAVHVYIYDKDEAKAKALAEEIGADFATSEEIAECSSLLFIATKPNIVPEVASSLRGKVKGTVVSMAAGVMISRLEELFGEVPIIRIMPNTPVSVGSGVVVFAKNGLVSEETVESFLLAMSKSGIVEPIDEDKIDAITALTGCGPAFVYMFAMGLAKGAKEAGLSAEVAAKYAAGVTKGAAEMLLTSSDSPEALVKAVCSPGGSTIEGVHYLEDKGFIDTVAATVTTSYKKTKALGK